MGRETNAYFGASTGAKDSKGGIMTYFILFFTLVSLFIAAWMYFIGVFDKWPAIVFGGYKIEENRQKIIAAFGVPPLLVGNIETYKLSKEAILAASEAFYERWAHDLIYGTGKKHPPGLLNSSE